MRYLRVMRLVRLLASPGGHPLETLAVEVGFDVRTVRRDLRDLRSQGYRVVRELTPAGVRFRLKGVPPALRAALARLPAHPLRPVT